MRLDAYLHAHFLDRAAFAAHAGITSERLDALVAAGAAPRPSYICDGASITSAVFGRTAIDPPIIGHWYRAACARWVRIADAAPPGEERAALLAVLVPELHDALAADGVPVEAIDATVARFLPAFFDGTFGLCVADPATGDGIVRKERLQERLAALAAAPDPNAAAARAGIDLAALIDAYAAAAMPFSPAEYQRSSRKRLVEDLRASWLQAGSSVSGTAS